MREKEYPPLLETGMKDLTEADLHSEFVGPFRYQVEEHRTGLLRKFKEFLAEYKTLGIAAEVWIDGSFATIAPDPSDVDVVFFFDSREVDELAGDRLSKFEKLFQDRKFIRNLYQVEVHYGERNNELHKKQWERTFGTWYDNITPKGMFRLNYPS